MLRFKHKLALALGCFVSDLDRMSFAEFMSWQAYDVVEPFGIQRENYHASLIASAVVNGYSKRPCSPDKFMYISPGLKRKNNIEQFKRRLQGLSKNKKTG